VKKIVKKILVQKTTKKVNNFILFIIVIIIKVLSMFFGIFYLYAFIYNAFSHIHINGSRPAWISSNIFLEIFA